MKKHQEQFLKQICKYYVTNLSKQINKQAVISRKDKNKPKQVKSEHRNTVE